MAILRAPRARLGAAFETFAARSARPVFFVSAEDGWSWSALRFAYEQVRADTGCSEPVASTDEEHAALELVLGATSPPSKRIPSENDSRADLAADPRSHLTHNWALKRPLMETLASCLGRGLTRGDHTLLVPDLGSLDRESLTFLKTLARTTPVRLVVGYDPRREDPACDERGLMWEASRRTVIAAASSLLRHPRARLVSASERPTDGGRGAAWPRPPDALCPERTWVHRLGNERGSELDHTVARACRVLRACFRGFGFDSTLKLGLAVLAHRNRLSARQRTATLNLVGLAAHNRQFRSQGNQRLADFLERCWRDALETAEPGDLRSAILYRLAVTFGRRKGDIETATVWAEQAVETSGRSDLSPFQRAYQEAWGRNIRSFVRMRSQQRDAALEDATAGYERLAEARVRHPPSGAVWQRDLDATQGLLAGSGSTLHFFALDWRQAREWRARCESIEGHHPGVARFECQSWIDLHRAEHRLDAALDRAMRGLDDARSERDAFLEYGFLLQIADLAYRLGDLDSACARFDELRALHADLGAPAELPSGDLASVGTYVRSGRMATADAILTRSLASRDDDLDACAEMFAWRARIAATSGERQRAEALMDQSIDRACRSGRLETLTQAAAMAGDIARRLGARHQASEAYGRALSLLGDGEHAKRPGMASAILRARVGLADLDVSDAGSLDDVVGLIRPALKDPETWWLLPRLAPRVLGVVGSSAERAFDDVPARESFALLDRVWRQRRDDSGPRLRENRAPVEVAEG